MNQRSVLAGLAAALVLATTATGCADENSGATDTGATNTTIGDAAGATTAIPVSLAAMPTKASLDQFLDTGAATTASGATVTISETGHFALPEDDGLQHCSATSTTPDSSPTMNVDGRFTASFDGVDDQLERSRILESIVMLSARDIRALTDGTTDSIDLLDSPVGSIKIKRPGTADNPGKGYRITTKFGKWTDSYSPWDFGCAGHVGIGFDGGKAVVQRSSTEPEALFEPSDNVRLSDLLEVPALGSWVQTATGPTGSIAKQINPDGSVTEVSISNPD